MVLLVAGIGCSAEPWNDDYVSDDPRRYGLAWGTVGSGEYTDGTAMLSTTAPSPELAAVADVVRIEGDRLYALSRASGLMILDVSNPSDLRTLGRAELDATPFAMHLRDGVVYAVFSEWRQLFEDAGGTRPVMSGHVEVLDASTPETIVRVGAIDVPGALRDTRMKGAILYTVAYESDGCSGCEPGTAVVVRSFDTSDPTSVTPIDAVRVDQVPPTSWKTSFAETRVYIPVKGGVQVIDLSDPSGQLEFGAIVETAGAPMAMDEFAGALRVVSSLANPTQHQLEAFAITSSTSIDLLASVPLPTSEQPYDVRFDGPRAYALSNPMVAVDLAQPATPVVGAPLASPAFVLEVEPRGDRLFVLALGSASATAPVGVWLFDTADVGAPHLLATATFGDPETAYGDWTRAMAIVPEADLVLVPYPTAPSAGACGASTATTVQLIEWSADQLTVRGAATLEGAPWRALVRDGSLIALSDEAATFDVSNRDTPAALDRERVATPVSDVVREGEWLVRLSTVGSPRLDIVPASDPETPVPVGSLDLAEAFADVNPYTCADGFKLSTYEHKVYIAFSTLGGTRVLIVDIADPAHPTEVGRATGPAHSYPTSHERLVTSASASVVQVEDQVVIEVLAPQSGDGEAHGGSLTKLDLSDPTTPTTMTLQLPTALGHSGLVPDGDRLFLTHWEPADPNDAESREVRFYLDRVRVAPGIFELEPPISVPGSFVAWDAATHHLLTADYHRVEEPSSSGAVCTQHLGALQEPQEDGSSVCAYLKRTLVLTEIDEEDASASVLGEIDLPEEQLFGGPMNDGAFLLGLDAYSTGPDRVHAVRGLATGALEIGTAELPGGRSKITSDGTTLVHMWGGIVTVVDASDVGAMTAVPIAVVSTTYNPESIDLIGDQLLVSRGAYGLDAVSIEK